MRGTRKQESCLVSRHQEFVHIKLQCLRAQVIGASAQIVELLKGENILTGPKMVYSIFIEPLESLLFLQNRVIFSKPSFLIQYSRKGSLGFCSVQNKNIHVKESPQSVGSCSANRAGTEAGRDCRAHGTEQRSGEVYPEEKPLSFLIMLWYLINVRLLHQITLVLIKCHKI